MQRPFYDAESFDLGTTTTTFTLAGLALAKYTAGTMYYTRLDLNPGMQGPVNGYISALWSKGSGTAGSAFFGLYTTDGTKLYLLGSTADQGSTASGVIRKALTFTSSLSMPQTATMYAPVGVLYVGLLVKTDSGTNHVDVATSSPFAVASCSVNADPTGGGMLPRAFYGAGTSLTALAATETLSGVTASGLLMWCAID